METFFFVAKKWLMFSDFSWELWNIFQTVFRPKIPKTKPFKAAHSYMALREYSLGAAPGGSHVLDYLWFSLCYSFGRDQNRERNGVVWIFRALPESFRDVVKIYMLVAAILNIYARRPTWKPHSSFILYYETNLKTSQFFYPVLIKHFLHFINNYIFYDFKNEQKTNTYYL